MQYQKDLGKITVPINIKKLNFYPSENQIKPKTPQSSSLIKIASNQSLLVVKGRQLYIRQRITNHVSFFAQKLLLRNMIMHLTHIFLIGWFNLRSVSMSEPSPAFHTDFIEAT